MPHRRDRSPKSHRRRRDSSDSTGDTSLERNERRRKRSSAKKRSQSKQQKAVHWADLPDTKGDKSQEKRHESDNDEVQLLKQKLHEVSMLCEQHESEELWLKERVFELIERNRLLREECTSLGKQNSDLKSQVAILVTNRQDIKNENSLMLQQLSTATDEKTDWVFRSLTTNTKLIVSQQKLTH